MKLAQSLCVINALLVLCAILLISCTTPVQVLPDDGVWYCEELQTQLSFDNKATSYMTVKGERTACQVENDRGSTQIMIICQEFDNQHYDLGELIMAMNHIDLANNCWTLQDDSGHQYVFERLDETT